MSKVYQLDSGLQEQLQAALEKMLDGHVSEWKEQVDDGHLGDEACSVFEAMGWVSSKRDSRLTVVESDPESE